MQTQIACRVHDTARVISPDLLRLGKNVHIMDYAVVGVPNEYRDGLEISEDRCVRIGDGTTVYPHVVIYEGATLGANVVMEEGTRVGSRTVVGDRTRIVYKAQIHDHVDIGTDCVIGGFVADNISIGSRTSVFGSLIHRYSTRDPRRWPTEDEPGPTLGDDVLVAWGAVIVGNVRIGSRAHICPNCVVTRDVAEGERVGGR